MAYNVNDLLNSSSDNYDIETDDLLENIAVRVPICLCLDTSGSMSTNGKINDLNEGIKEFVNILREDSIACDSAELCIIQMGGDEPKVICDFQPLDKVITHSEIGNFKPYGRTPIGQAAETGIILLNERKEKYKATSTDYYQPWLVIMSDGVSTDGPDKMKRATELVSSLVSAKKLVSIPVLIGEDEQGLRELSQFTPTKEVFSLDSLKLREFFKFLSMSVARVSCSIQGNMDVKDEIKSRTESITKVYTFGNGEKLLK